MLDDPTGGVLMPAARDHLGSCDRCRTEFADVVLTSYRVRRTLAVEDVAPPTDAWPRLRARVLRGRAGPSIGRIGSPVIQLALAAGLAVALFAAVGVGRPTDGALHEAGVEPAAIRAAGARDAQAEARQLWALALAGKEASSDDEENWARVALIRYEAAPVTTWHSPVRTPFSAAVQ